MADKPTIYAIGEAGLKHVIESISHPPSGGGTTGLEARVAKLEAIAEHTKGDIREIKDDLRKLLIGMLGAVVIIVSMLIVGYFRLSDQIGGISMVSSAPQATAQIKTP